MAPIRRAASVTALFCVWFVHGHGAGGDGGPGDYQKYMKLYAGDYQPYMTGGSAGAKGGVGGAGYYQKYMSGGGAGSSGGAGGPGEFYMKQYAGDYTKYMNGGSTGANGGVGGAGYYQSWHMVGGGAGTNGAAGSLFLTPRMMEDRLQAMEDYDDDLRREVDDRMRGEDEERIREDELREEEHNPERFDPTFDSTAYRLKYGLPKSRYAPDLNMKQYAVDYQTYMKGGSAGAKGGVGGAGYHQKYKVGGGAGANVGAGSLFLTPRMMEDRLRAVERYDDELRREVDDRMRGEDDDRIKEDERREEDENPERFDPTFNSTAYRLRYGLPKSRYALDLNMKQYAVGYQKDMKGGGADAKGGVGGAGGYQTYMSGGGAGANGGAGVLGWPAVLGGVAAGLLVGFAFARSKRGAAAEIPALGCFASAAVRELGPYIALDP